MIDPLAPPPPVLAFGLDVIHAIQSVRNPAMDALFKFFSLLGNEGFVLLGR